MLKRPLYRGAIYAKSSRMFASTFFRAADQINVPKAMSKLSWSGQKALLNACMKHAPFSAFSDLLEQLKGTHGTLGRIPYFESLMLQSIGFNLDCKENRRQKINALLQLGVDKNATLGGDKKGPTGLVLAVLAHDIGLVQLYLDAGADIHRSCDVEINGQHYLQMTALHAAALGLHFDLVQLLVSAGATVDAKDAAGYTPLLAFKRVHDGKPEVPSLRVRQELNNTTVFGNGSTELILAILDHDMEGVQQSLHAGVDLDCPCDMEMKGLRFNQITALHAAALAHHIDIAYLLVSKGAVVDAKDAAGQTPLLMLLKRQFHNSKQTGQMKCNAQLNRQELARMLVRLGADLFEPSMHGETPYGCSEESESDGHLFSGITSGLLALHLEQRDTPSLTTTDSRPSLG